MSQAPVSTTQSFNSVFTFTITETNGRTSLPSRAQPSHVSCDCNHKQRNTTNGLDPSFSRLKQSLPLNTNTPPPCSCSCHRMHRGLHKRSAARFELLESNKHPAGRTPQPVLDREDQQLCSAKRLCGSEHEDTQTRGPSRA
ncbi:hypothetical protein NXS19_002280 [Fusarium pseudograminearum]|nr:hypothetical protein NXS19_002280 [Fusarium pseudograminearum]